MFAVYDETVLVEIIRNGKKETVMFSDLVQGDRVMTQNGNHVVVGEAAHRCGDACYDGYLFYAESGEDYYPEDFGATLACHRGRDHDGEEKGNK